MIRVIVEFSVYLTPTDAYTEADLSHMKVTDVLDCSMLDGPPSSS